VTLSQEALVQPQSARAVTHEAVQCASLALAPCLSTTAFTPRTSAFTPAATATGDTNGYYLYTPELHLLAETAVTASSTKPIAYSYLWFGDIPAASIEAATNITRWYATDHLGTPLILTDTAGAVAWRAEYTPYGDVYTVRAGTSFHQPLRFPGQLAQDGSSLNYNVFRWYRSGWGRYTQTDPISIRNDANLYRYSADNPISFTDPRGLKCCVKSVVATRWPVQDAANGRFGVGHKVCWTVSNSDQCRVKQIIKWTEDYGGSGGVSVSSNVAIEESEHTGIPIVTRPAKTRICAIDMNVGFVGVKPQHFPLNDYRTVEAVAFDANDWSDRLAIKWSNTLECKDPSTCAISTASLPAEQYK
jgi:RHS repeat-associated protein